MHAYEIKWSKSKLKLYDDFLKSYDKSTIQLINKENFWDFASGEINIAK